MTADKGHIEADRVLRLFSERRSEARKAYSKFIAEGLTMGKDSSLYEAVEQQIIGGDRFIDKIQNKIEEPKRPIKKPKLADIVTAVTAVTGLSEGELVSMSRRKDIVLTRGVMAGIMRQSGYKLRDIAHLLKREISSISKVTRTFESADGRVVAKRVMKRLNTYNQA